MYFLVISCPGYYLLYYYNSYEEYFQYQERKKFLCRQLFCQRFNEFQKKERIPQILNDRVNSKD
jgi:hypothetical protein